jgi:hypothetical protein
MMEKKGSEVYSDQKVEVPVPPMGKGKAASYENPGHERRGQS